MHQIFNELLSKHDARIDKHASQPNKYRKLDFASEPSASSCSKQLSASESGTSLSSVAHPTASTLCDIIQEVHTVAPKLQGNEVKTAQMLLDDIPILQKWKCVIKPSNEVRDAMLKLGSRWNV